jgi:hypothetical protein
LTNYGARSLFVTVQVRCWPAAITPLQSPVKVTHYYCPGKLVAVQVRCWPAAIVPVAVVEC